MWRTENVANDLVFNIFHSQEIVIIGHLFELRASRRQNNSQTATRRQWMTANASIL